MINALTLLKIISHSEKEIKNDKTKTSEQVFSKIEKKLKKMKNEL